MMHENREEKNDRQRNADKPEQRASFKTHVSLLYDGVLRPNGKKVPTWELWSQKLLKPAIGCAVESVSSSGFDIIQALFVFRSLIRQWWIGNWSCDAVAKFPGIGHSVDVPRTNSNR